MRVSLDFASSWDPRGGVWRYGIELARALAAHLPRGAVRVPCFDHLPRDRLTEIRATGASVRQDPVISRVDRLDSMIRGNGRIVPWGKVLPLVYRPWIRDRLITTGLGACEVYHGVFTCRTRPSGAAVVGTIHDMLPVVYPELCGLTPAFHWRVVETHRRCADLIIVPSVASREDVIRLAPIAPERVRVVYHGIDHSTFKPGVRPSPDLLTRHGLTAGRFFLYVGAIERRKNVERMVRAYLRAVPPDTDVPLVISGARLHDIPALKAVEETGDRRVRFVGYVADADLAGLYASARALIHVAFVEGFGFTPLEAMACGTPAIVSRIGASAEVVGDAGVVVDPHDEEAIAQGIRSLLNNNDLRNRFAASGLARARDFTWDACARNTLAVYAEAISISRVRHP